MRGIVRGMVRGIGKRHGMFSLGPMGVVRRGFILEMMCIGKGDTWRYLESDGDDDPSGSMEAFLYELPV